MKNSVILLVLMMLFTSCSELMPGDGKFVVKDVVEHSEYSKYELGQTSGRGNTYFYDSVGKYHVGDTLYICSHKCR